MSNQKRQAEHTQHQNPETETLVKTVEGVLSKEPEASTADAHTEGASASSLGSDNPFAFLKSGRYHGSMTRHDCEGGLTINFVNENVHRPGSLGSVHQILSQGDA